MANFNANQTSNAPAEKTEWVRLDRYTGSAGAIVATGLVRLEQLPGQPGRHPSKVFYRNGEDAEPVRRLDYQPDAHEWVRVDRPGDDGQYVLTVGLLPAEVVKRRAAEAARRAAEHRAWRDEVDAKYEAKRHAPIDGRDRERRLRDAFGVLREMPNSREDYLKSLSDELHSWVLWRLKYESTRSERERYHGYALDPGAVDNIMTACDFLVEAIVQAEVTFNPTVHRQVTAKYRLELASLDEGFQSQLAKLTRQDSSLAGEGPT